VPIEAALMLTPKLLLRVGFCYESDLVAVHPTDPPQLHCADRQKYALASGFILSVSVSIVILISATNGWATMATRPR
jgi:hypothetical protein